MAMSLFFHSVPPFVPRCRLMTLAALTIAAPVFVACGGDDGQEAVPPATFTSLGAPTGYTNSAAMAVSADGSIVVGTATNSAGDRQAFRWSEKLGPIGLGFMPGGTHSAATAVSADGSVVVGIGDSTTEPATPAGLFRWTNTSGVVRLSSPLGAYLCSGSGISGDGMIVVGTCLTINSEAFRWNALAPPISLGRFGGGSNQTSSAVAVSKDGSTIVGTGHPVLTGALLWDSDGSPTVLGMLVGDATSSARAVSRDGAVVVGTSIDNSQVARAFRWTQAKGMTALGSAPPGFNGTFATGISGVGSIVVGYGTGSGTDAALIWDSKHAWRTLADALEADFKTVVPGWKLTRAMAISDDGRTIVGYGVNPGGQTEAWLVRLPR